MTMKGFKITDADRKFRVGIAAKDLNDLKTKIIDKFKLKSTKNDDINIQTQDGTLIENDEYFDTIYPQSLLIWVKIGERAPTDAEILYKTIREVNDEYLTAGEKVQEFFTEKMKAKVFKLAEVLREIDRDKTKFSSKTDHPEWFEGLDTNAKTKEEYMFRRAQDRIRSYYYKTREELLKQTTLIQHQHNNLNLLLNELYERLKLTKFHGYYFDRNYHHHQSLCNKNGDFYCHGRWDKTKCLYDPCHTINPYVSREERIIFQTWNLDHCIERSRSIIPAIMDALQKYHLNTKQSIDYKAIYNDLFTLNNLRFVHIVCHDKGAHLTKKAGPYLIL